MVHDCPVVYASRVAGSRISTEGRTIGTLSLQTWASFGAALSALPYAAIKVLWLAGVEVGVNSPGLMATTTYRVANAVTLVMDLAVIGLAFALTGFAGGRWQRRAVPVMWFATGLLLSPVLTACVLASGTVATDASVEDGLQTWVYAVVYGGFALQACCLAASFGILMAPRIREPRMQSAEGTWVGAGRTAVLMGGVTTVGFVLADLSSPSPQASADFGVAAFVSGVGVLGVWLWLSGRMAGAALVGLWLASSSSVMWGLYVRLIVSREADWASWENRLWEAHVVCGLLLSAILVSTARANRGEGRTTTPPW